MYHNILKCLASVILLISAQTTLFHTSRRVAIEEKWNEVMEEANMRMTLPFAERYALPVVNFVDEKQWPSIRERHAKPGGISG